YRGSVDHLKKDGGFRGLALPGGLVEELLVLSPSATAGAPDAVFQDASLGAGVRGNAFIVTPNSKGFLGKDVGYYDRADAFSFDLWIYVPEDGDFTDATIVNHRDHNVWTGDSGYTLNIEGDRLRFDVIHMSPFNMLSVAAMDPVPA